MPRGFNQQTFHCDQSKGIAKKKLLVFWKCDWSTHLKDPTIMFSGNTIIQSSVFHLFHQKLLWIQVCLIWILHAISCAQVAGRHEKCSVEHLFLQPSFQTSSCFIEGQTVYLCLVCWIMPEGSITFILFAVDWPLNSMPQISNQSC